MYLSINDVTQVEGRETHTFVNSRYVWKYVHTTHFDVTEEGQIIIEIGVTSFMDGL